MGFLKIRTKIILYIGLFLLFGHSQTFAFDISTSSLYSTFNYGNTDRFQIQIKDNDTKLYILDRDNQLIKQYNLTTPGDISTAIYNSETTLGNYFYDFDISNDGTKLFALAPTDYAKVGTRQYSLSTPFMINTKGSPSYYLQFEAGATYYPYSNFISKDGTKYFLNLNGTLYYYTLSSINDINTASLVGTYSLSGLLGDIYFSDDGNTFFIGGNNIINQYSLSTPFIISSKTFISSLSSIWGNTTKIYYTFNKNGNFIYISSIYDEINTTIKQYNNDDYINGQPFTFTSDGFQFYNNGFTYNNFVPGNTFTGGLLYFVITYENEDSTNTRTYNSDFYGINKYVEVTDPYHERMGFYLVEAYYMWNWGTYFLEDGIYEISKDGIPFTSTGTTAVDEIKNFDWDYNNDGEVGIGEFFRGVGESIKAFFQGIYDFFINIRNLFRELMRIGTKESRDFAFINNANASELTEGFDIDPEGTSTLFDNFSNFAKYGFFLMLLLIILGLIIAHKNK